MSNINIVNGNIIKIIIYFEDDTFVVFDKLIEYKLDLYNKDLSSIELRNYFIDTEILTRFCNNTDEIKQINFIVTDIENKESQSTTSIRCDMYIKNFVATGEVGSVTEMKLTLEGRVKHNGKR